MPLYRYRAVDSSGRPVTGTMDEVSAQKVTTKLEEQGFQVSAVDPAQPAPAYPKRQAPLSWQDIEFLNSQLLALARSNLPIAPALAALGKELHRGPLRTLLGELRIALESGSTLSDAFERHRGAVPPVYVAAIRAGEETGNLTAILELCGGYTAQMATVRARLRETLTYPIVVLVGMVMVLTYMLAFVVPQFTEIFKDFGAKLPAMTMFWIEVSDAIRYKYPVIITAICFIFIIAIAIRRSSQGRYVLDWVRLKMWGVGNAFNAASMARFCRSLGILLSGKAPLDASIELASATCGNMVLEAAALDASESVRRGSKLSSAFDTTGYFSSLFCWLIQVSEDRGEVDRALLDLAKSYDETFARSSRMVLTALTPALLAFMGFVVLSVLVALYLPIFSLADAISGQ